jgi:hypothetical protein
VKAHLQSPRFSYCVFFNCPTKLKPQQHLLCRQRRTAHTGAVAPAWCSPVLMVMWLSMDLWQGHTPVAAMRHLIVFPLTLLRRLKEHRSRVLGMRSRQTRHAGAASCCGLLGGQSCIVLDLFGWVFWLWGRGALAAAMCCPTASLSQLLGVEAQRHELRTAAHVAYSRRT